MPEAATASPLAPAGHAERVLRQLEWSALKRLDGMLEGDYQTLFRGLGLDLADLREYQFTDDVRHIDWNVTARVQTPHVREFHQEREATAWFLLDLSGSMHFGAQAVSKLDLLQRFTGLFARMLTRHGNRIGGVIYRDRVEAVVPARGGRAQVLELLHRVMAQAEAPRAPQAGDAAAGQGTDLSALLARAGGMMRRRSMVFVVSDFICAPGWGEPLGRLAERHDVLAVRLVDPLERELPDLGLVAMQDAESGEQLLVDTADAGFRRRFVDAVAQHEAQLRVAFGDAGVDALELSTDEDLVDSVRRFIALRKLRARLGAGGGASQWRAPSASSGPLPANPVASGGGHVLPVA